MPVHNCCPLQEDDALAAVYVQWRIRCGPKYSYEAALQYAGDSNLIYLAD
jgi:hypothetical protein